MPEFSVRFTADQLRLIDAVTEQRGFATRNAYIRRAVGRDATGEDPMQKILAVEANISKRLDAIQRRVETLFLYLDTMLQDSLGEEQYDEHLTKVAKKRAAAAAASTGSNGSSTIPHNASESEDAV